MEELKAGKIRREVSIRKGAFSKGGELSAHVANRGQAFRFAIEFSVREPLVVARHRRQQLGPVWFIDKSRRRRQLILRGGRQPSVEVAPQRLRIGGRI